MTIDERLIKNGIEKLTGKEHDGIIVTIQECISEAVEEKNKEIESLRNSHREYLLCRSLLNDANKQVASYIEWSSKQNEMRENHKQNLIEICEFFSVDGEYTSEQLELFFIGLGEKLNHALTKYKESKDK